MPYNELQEKIEHYHSGNMSAGDKTSFENEIASDPGLKAESDFQSDIINGIKEYRKTQLKTRLDAIDVSPGWIEFARQSALVKSFGGVAVASLIGSAVYFYAEAKVEEPAEISAAGIEAYGPVDKEFTFVWDIPMFKTTSETKTSTISVTKQKSEPEQSVAVKEVVQSAFEPAAEEAKESFTPDFSAPEAGEITEDQKPTASTLDIVPVASATDAKNEEPIEVETKNSKNSKIRYKYYDGKLFLNGDFKKEPYEILEINSSKGRRIYLLHQKKYFEVKTTDRLTELPEVTNVKLIQELRLLKENK